MDIFKMNEMTGGWFVGDFTPSVLRTKDFEVAYAKHYKGQRWDVHYHAEATEINYLIRGKMKIQNKIISPGEIFVLKPYEIADPEFIEDCELIVVKTPSVIGDKHAIVQKRS